MTDLPPPMPGAFPARAIRVSGEPEPADWKMAVRLLNRSRGARPWVALIYVYTVVIGLLIFCWRHDLRLMVYIFVPTLTALLAWSYAWRRQILRESLAKRARISTQDEWTLEQNRVTRRYGPNHGAFEWRFLETVLVSDDLLVLMPTAQSCHCIPMRFFSDRADAMTVIDYARGSGVTVKDFRKESW